MHVCILTNEFFVWHLLLYLFTFQGDIEQVLNELKKSNEAFHSLEKRFCELEASLKTGWIQFSKRIKQ